MSRKNSRSHCHLAVLWSMASEVWEMTWKTVVLGSHWKHCFSVSTSVPSALEVYLYTTMRYINQRFTYLLTMAERQCVIARVQCLHSSSADVCGWPVVILQLCTMTHLTGRYCAFSLRGSTCWTLCSPFFLVTGIYQYHCIYFIPYQCSCSCWFYQRYWILQSFVISYIPIFNLSIFDLYFIVAK